MILVAQEKLPTLGQAGKISSSLLLSSCKTSSSFAPGSAFKLFLVKPLIRKTGNRPSCLVILPLVLLKGEGGVLPTVLMHGDPLLPIHAIV